MKITDAFLGEHGAFYAQFDHLEKTQAQESQLAILRARAALLAAALASHATLENELLFDPLADAMGGPAGPVAVMRAEHARIDAALADIDRSTTTDTARDLLTQVIELARDHFVKEERVAFPLAENVLGVEFLSRQAEDWAHRRGVALA